MTLPEKFVERVLRDLGSEEGAALCAALDGPPPVSIRLNPSKCGAKPAAQSPFGGDNSEGPHGKEGQADADIAGNGVRADANIAGNGVRAGETVAGSVPGRGNVAAGEDGGCGEAIPADAKAPAEEETHACANVPEEALLRRLGATHGVPWCESGWYLGARPQFTFDPAFHAGAYYVQEAASQFVGRLLDDPAGKRILDLCAAPGGKTTLYASLAGPEGLVVANEVDRRRAGVLADNVRKWGTGNVAVTTCEPQALGDFEGWFDAVAVDAPCSGEGMFRKDDAARGEWSESAVKRCAARQDAILREAWRALRPGGTLLYSTCTFNRDEDEGALERMLAWAADEVAEAPVPAVDELWGVVCGRVGPFRTFRFYPHRTCGEGFFAAVARKAPDAGGRSRTPKARRRVFSPADSSAAAELRRWVLNAERMHFAEVAGTYYCWPAAQAGAVKMLAEALPVIYSGTALGPIYKGRLKPDPALALSAGLNRGALPSAELDNEAALRYLRRQEVHADALCEGLNLICSEGRALGFAKRMGARVNNMYPNSLRIIKQ